MTPALCSADWDDSALPAWGSAKDARVIVVVEVGGSWGRDAVADAGLKSPKGATLYVVRSPGRHAETPSLQRVIVSGGFDNEPWLVTGKLNAPGVSTFLSGDVVDESWWAKFGFERSDEPAFLVCTNGVRDTCCAVRGRPVAQSAYAAEPTRTWEVSHIGGHRFAPTAIHLPSGQTFGRLTGDDAATLARVATTDSLPAELFSRAKHRGRVDLSPAQRVAETWWREQHTELPLTPPVAIGAATKTDGGGSVELPDGTTLLVTTHKGPELRDSCIKNPKPSQYYEGSLDHA